MRYPDENLPEFEYFFVNLFSYWLDFSAGQLAVCVKAIIYSSFAFKVSGAFSSCLSLSYFLLCLSPLFASLS